MLDNKYPAGVAFFVAVNYCSVIPRNLYELFRSSSFGFPLLIYKSTNKVRTAHKSSNYINLFMKVVQLPY